MSQQGVVNEQTSRDSTRGRSRAELKILDALRGIAVLAVMLLHNCERGGHGKDAWFHGSLWPVVSHGYLGVQLFFVISGYCITAAVYAQMKRENLVGDFMYRRARRIFPPYWWSLLLVVVMALLSYVVLKTPLSTSLPLSPAEWFWNIVLLQGPAEATDANLVYWSLSIEIQFYVVMAICLLRPSWAEAWLLCISFINVWLVTYSGMRLSGWVFNYWAEFACGIAAYYWITRHNRWAITPWLLMASAASIVLLTWRWYPGCFEESGRFITPIKILFCMACGGAFVALSRADAWLCSCRWVQPFMWVGIVSYSFYLTHVPIGTRVFNLGERVTGLDQWRWLVYLLGAFCMQAAFGWIFYRICERPWLNHKRTLPIPSAKSEA